MAWLGAADRVRKPAYHPLGLGADAPRGKVPHRLIATGTIVIETYVPDQFHQPCDLIEFERTGQERRALHIVLGPNGRLWAAVERGREMMMVSLDMSRWEKDTPVRLSLSWSLPTKRGVLGAENLLTGEVLACEFSSPVGLYESDLARVLYAFGGRAVAGAVSSFSFADHVEKLGYSNGIAADGVVDTEFGPKEICDLEPGMLVVGDDGQLSPLVAVVPSVLPNFGAMGAIRLWQPFQKLKEAVDVAQFAAVMMEGVDSAYLFGASKVWVAAREISPYLPQQRHAQPLLTKRYNLVLRDGSAFGVNGINVKSIHCAHRADIHAHTRLSLIPFARLPDIEAEGFIDLSPHEATALFSDRFLS